MLIHKNHKSDMQLDQKPVVLIIGPVFPKGGGVGMVNLTLLKSNLINEYELIHLDTGRSRAGEGKEGTLSILNFYYFFYQFFQLIKIMIFRHPHIIHQSVSWGIAFWKESFFMLLARIFGCRVIAHIHGSKLDVQLLESNRFKKWLFSFAFRTPDVLIVLSERWKNFLLELISPSLNIAVVPNCIEQSIAETMDQATYQSKKTGCLVLFIGWLGVRKGLLDAIRAIPLVQQQVPNVRFVFAGPLETGPRMREITTAIQEAKSYQNVEFPGMVVGRKKLALLSAARLFILPSYHENLPVAILEAMAMGLPVVTTTVAGIPEIIEEGKNGYLIQPGDFNTLANRIIFLAQNSELCQTIGQANIEKVRNEYHPRVFSSKIAMIYKKLLYNDSSDIKNKKPVDIKRDANHSW